MVGRGQRTKSGTAVPGAGRHHYASGPRLPRLPLHPAYDHPRLARSPGGPFRVGAATRRPRRRCSALSSVPAQPAAFDPSTPCTADGRAAGAYPDLEASIPAIYDARGPDHLDSGRNCTARSLRLPGRPTASPSCASRARSSGSRVGRWCDVRGPRGRRGWTSPGSPSSTRPAPRAGRRCRGGHRRE